MCGIFGVVYTEEKKDLGEILLKVAEKLEYRGYDSCGFATVNKDGEYDLRKDKGKIKDVGEKYNVKEMKGYKGILQLRWATFGKPSKENSQPHIDCTKSIITAHNGNIVNTPELIYELKNLGHNFKGDNDGEVVCHVVEEQFKKTGSLEIAIREADKILKGDYAYVATLVKEKKIFAVKKGSSLYAGIGDGFVCASSDLPSLLFLTRKYIPLDDGEYIEFDDRSYSIKSLKTGEIVDKEVLIYEGDVESAEKGDYPHFMLKEIYEQGKTSSSLVKYLFEKQAEDFAKELSSSKRLFLIGSGTSFHAGYMGAYFFNKLTKINAQAVYSSEFFELYRDKFGKGDSFFLISQSGETKDTINVLNYLRDKEIKNIYSLVNVSGSTLSIRVKRSFPIISELEIGVAATKTFTNEVISLLGISAIVGKNRDILKRIKKLPEIIERFTEKADVFLREIAEEISTSKNLYILGYGISYPSALEGALKMKEITYIPTEAYYSGEFKHGPLALIEDGQPVFFISTLEDKEKTISAINEVKVRGGKIITVAPNDSSLLMNSDKFVEIIDDFYYFVPLLAVIFFQLLSYRVSVLLGNDPDKPRNLSKTITVD